MTSRRAFLKLLPFAAAAAPVAARVPASMVGLARAARLQRGAMGVYDPSLGAAYGSRLDLLWGAPIVPAFACRFPAESDVRLTMAEMQLDPQRLPA